MIFIEKIEHTTSQLLFWANKAVDPNMFGNRWNCPARKRRKIFKLLILSESNDGKSIWKLNYTPLFSHKLIHKRVQRDDNWIRFFFFKLTPNTASLYAWNKHINSGLVSLPSKDGMVCSSSLKEATMNVKRNYVQ